MALPGHIDLNDLRVFDAVAETGGFTAAAERLGVATAKVSLEISRLESRLGTALFNRTTRKVVLTDAGQQLHMECQPLLRSLDDVINRVGSGENELTGTLRIAATVDHAMQSLAPALSQFARLHPRLALDLRTGDKIVDLVEQGIDVSIRIGWLRDSSMRAVKLGEFEQYVVASPAYIKRTSRPRHPDDLAEHDWVALTLLPTPLTWKFTSATGEATSIQVKTRFRVDSPSALCAILEQDAGMSVLDQFSAQQSIKAKRLVRLLPEWSLPVGGIYAVFPPGRHFSAKVRAFIDFYRDYLAAR